MLMQPDNICSLTTNAYKNINLLYLPAERKQYFQSYENYRVHLSKFMAATTVKAIFKYCGNVKL
jgi:hypothetical protein